METASVMQILRVSFLVTLFSFLDVSNQTSPPAERVPACVLIVIVSSVVFFIISLFVHSWISKSEVKWQVVSKHMTTDSDADHVSYWIPLILGISLFLSVFRTSCVIDVS